MDPANRYHFGAFDFDAAAGELRRDGVVVRLQGQPAQALGLLLSRAGQVVSREALRDAVWGAETFVDYERGLNFCIAQVRSALGDSAESPRYIRTIPKRGYQFIAPVSGGAPAPATPERRRSRWPIAAALAALAGLAVLAARPWAPRPVERIAITHFDNETGDGGFDRFAGDLTDNLVAEMTASMGPRAGVIGNAAILSRPRAERDLGAIGVSLHAGYVVLGQVQREASGIRVLAHLIRLPDQSHLWVVRLAGTPADLTRSPAELARRIAAEFSHHLSSSRPATN